MRSLRFSPHDAESEALALRMRFLQTAKRYGLSGSVRLLRDWTATRFGMPAARLVRRPLYVRGRQHMLIGAGFTSGPRLRLDAFPVPGTHEPVLRIGRDVQVNDDVHIAAVESVTIGDGVLIASRVFISDHHHGATKGAGPHEGPDVPPAERSLATAPVAIEDHVWIGEGACVLAGVRVGRGAIVGALSVVTRNVPPATIVAGAPARPVKRWNAETARWESL